MLSPSDAALIGSIARGHSASLDRMGLQPEWVVDTTVRKFISTALDLTRRNLHVNLVQVMAGMADCDPVRRKEVVQIWTAQKELNGHGDVDPKIAISAALDAHHLRETSQIQADVERLMRESPGEVSKWLPQITGRFASVVTVGSSYDPHITAHLEKPPQSVRFKSRIPGLNAIMRGGYWDSFLGIFIAPTGHGKSSVGRTIAIDCAYSQRKCAIISNEGSESEISHRLMQAITGVSAQEKAEGFRDMQFGDRMYSAAEREAMYKGWVEYINDYVRVYGPQFYNDHQIRRILKWEKPDAVVIDYLRKFPGMISNPSKNSNDEVGDMADFLLTVSRDPGAHIYTAAQTSGEHAIKLMANENEQITQAYGSVRVQQASDIYGLIRRTQQQNILRSRVWKDRLTNVFDSVHEIPFDSTRWTLEFPVSQLTPVQN